MPPLALLGTLLAAAVGLAMIRVEEPVVVLGGPPGWPGAMPAAAVALVAVWAWLTLRSTTVGPVRRLRDNVLAGSCGRRMRRSIVRDVDRIAVDVRDFGRPVSGGMPRRDRRPRLPMTAVLVLVGVVVLGSLAASYVVMSRSNALDSQVLAVETGQDTARAGDRLRSAILGGLSTLQGVTGPAAGGAADPEATVSTMLAARPVFRAVYILDPAGRLVAAAGAQPRPAGVPPAAGIRQLNTSGSVPLIVAAASLYDGDTLVGEYDPRALNDVLRISGARMRVIDTDMRTVLSNHGYEAFSKLRDPQLRTAAAAPAPAGLVPVATVRTVDDADATVAAQQIGADDDPLTPLDWVLLANQDLSDGKFAHNPAGRAAAVVAGLGAGAALALLCWIYLATVRPLRGAAAHAAAIAAARSGGVPPASEPAQRVDEIGAITAGLNRHLHALDSAPPIPLSRVTLPVPPPLPPSPISHQSSAAGQRRLVERGSADWHLDDRAMQRGPLRPRRRHSGPRRELK